MVMMIHDDDNGGIDSDNSPLKSIQVKMNHIMCIKKENARLRK